MKVREGRPLTATMATHLNSNCGNETLQSIGVSDTTAFISAVPIELWGEHSSGSSASSSLIVLAVFLHLHSLFLDIYFGTVQRLKRNPFSINHFLKKYSLTQNSSHRENPCGAEVAGAMHCVFESFLLDQHIFDNNGCFSALLKAKY